MPPRMTNVQVPMTKELPMTKLQIGHWNLGIIWSLVLGHWSLAARSFASNRRRRARVGAPRRFGPASGQIAHDLDVLENAALAGAVLAHPIGHGGDAFFQRGLAAIAERVVA